METQHQRERRERAEDKAARLRRASEAALEGSRKETEHIPMGQPILVGHHSEKRHRKALARQDAQMRRAVDLHTEANEAAARATGAGRSISSDDPEALDALTEKVAELEASRDREKRLNRLWRKGGADALRADGVDERAVAAIEAAMKRCPWMKAPFDTKNISARIRTTKKRIAELVAAAERPEAEPIIGDGFSILEHKADNRIRFEFNVRPAREVTRKMRAAGFLWSRAHGAWQRHLNNAGRQSALRMARELFGHEVAA